MKNTPAFPHPNPNYDGNWDKEPQRGGMTLLDYFAAKAMQAMCCMDYKKMINQAYSDTLGEEVERCIAKAAYDQAEAMLAEREKRN